MWLKTCYSIQYLKTCCSTCKLRTSTSSTLLRDTQFHDKRWKIKKQERNNQSYSQPHLAAYTDRLSDIRTKNSRVPWSDGFLLPKKAQLSEGFYSRPFKTSTSIWPDACSKCHGQTSLQLVLWFSTFVSQMISLLDALAESFSIVCIPMSSLFISLHLSPSLPHAFFG